MQHVHSLSRRAAGALVVLLLAVGVTLSTVGDGPVAAGNGTPASPWQNGIASTYSWPTIQSINYVYQNMRGAQTQAWPNVSFWAANLGFTKKGGYYFGLQSNGLLHGSNGSNGAIRKSRLAYFSLFSNGDSTNFRILQPTVCTNGADNGTGAACSIEYNWSTSAEYRLHVDVLTAPSGGWCPGNTLPCKIYVGSVAPASNPNSKTQIAAWSVRENVFGITGNGYSFLEVPGSSTSTFCPPAGHPEGYFVLPFKNSGGSDYSISSSSNFDNPASCGDAWSEGLRWRVKY